MNFPFEGVNIRIKFGACRRHHYVYVGDWRRIRHRDAYYRRKWITAFWRLFATRGQQRSPAFYSGAICPLFSLGAPYLAWAKGGRLYEYHSR